MKKHLSSFGTWMKRHKFLATLVVLLVFGIGYYIYSKAFASPAVTQYVYGTVKRGIIQKTVTGSGQVAAENQIDITSEASGKITSIVAKVGQHVNQGDLIATIDSRDALLDLENAKLSLAKLTKPAKIGDVTNAENDVTKSLSDALAAISNIFLHFPTVGGGLKDMLYSQTGFLTNLSTIISETGRKYRATAQQSYENANAAYENLLNKYHALNKTSSPDEINLMIEWTLDMEKLLAQAVKDAQAAQNFISTSQPDYNRTDAASAFTSLSTWSATVASDLSSLISSRNGIDSSNVSLQKLNEGADSLDIQSAQLSIQQKQRAYDKYFIRAPFEGMIGRIPVEVYNQANSGTVIATISSSKKVTTIPLNEVDAVQVKPGQKVTLTFDAIEGLTVNGEVTQVDLIGTASQGVVTYNVKIAFDGTDPRIRAGMSVDANIVTDERDDVVVVPAGAIKTKGFGKNITSYVEAQGENGAITQIPITTGMTDDTNTEIVSGLNEGNKIVVRTIAGTGTRSTTPTLFSSFGGGGQRNIIQNANRTGVRAGTGAGTAR